MFALKKGNTLVSTENTIGVTSILGMYTDFVYVLCTMYMDFVYGFCIWILYIYGFCIWILYVHGFCMDFVYGFCMDFVYVYILLQTPDTNE
jgi:hypothetical protein